MLCYVGLFRLQKHSTYIFVWVLDLDRRHMVCRTIDTAEGTGNTAALRGYQREALDRIKQGGNYIVVAPTGKCIFASASTPDNRQHLCTACE